MLLLRLLQCALRELTIQESDNESSGMNLEELLEHIEQHPETIEEL